MPFLIFLFAGSSFAQFKNYKTVADTFKINLENVYCLSSTNILPGSERVFLNRKKLNRNEYSISLNSNCLSLSDTLRYSLLDTLIIIYNSVKIPLQKEYYNQILVKKFDKFLNDTISVIDRKKFRLTNEAIFGNAVKKNGTLVRGITIGTNQDATINSGLRLELSGKLSEDIEVIAALSDQNSPIQPEGVTERLNEVDKVFIEIRHKNAVGTFGDYFLKENLGEFLKINRKLQGLKATANYKNYKGFAAYASQRGKYATNKFNGQDGVQGPYRLFGKNNEKNIIVIAGTERVYLDGQLMKRGERNDYIIDYANATITFKTRRIITATSRIFVEFEYTDRKYPRSFWAANGSARIFDDKLRISASYVKENDNENSPIDFTLSDEDLAILKEAGNDPLKAVKSGVTLAPLDTATGTRNGIYSKIDTTINGEPFSYYLYSPGTETAIYYVTFSYVGEGKGDYVKINLKQYDFVGIGKGAYLPVKFLPLPEKNQIANFSAKYEPFEGITLLGEIAGSEADKNKLSKIDDEQNRGYATKFAFLFNKKRTEIFGINLGSVDFSFKNRFIQNNFKPVERLDNVEFNRNYNIDENAEGNQLLRELNFNYKPVNNMQLSANYGVVKYGDAFASDRYVFTFKFQNEKKYNFHFYNNYVSSLSNGRTSSFWEQKGNAYYLFGKIQPGINFLRDTKNEFLPSADTLINNSHNYVEFQPYLELKNISGLMAAARVKFRKEANPLNNKLTDENEIRSTQIDLTYRGIKEFTTTFSLAFQKKKYTDAFKKKGMSDNETVLIRSRTQLNLFNNFFKGDLFYNTATEKASKLERIFLPVPDGTGNYIYLGDLNNNGIADEEEFQPTVDGGNFILTTVPTDELFPVISLQSNARLRFDFAKLFRRKSFFKTVFSPISAETFVRVDEKSKINETEKIYLLNQRYFLNDSTTLNGSNQFRNDIYLFRTSGVFSLRLRYYQKKYLRQYSAGSEKGYYRERTLRARFKIAKEMRNQTDIEFINDNVNSETALNKSRNAFTQKISFDFSYRPYNRVELGLKFGAGRVEDTYPETPSQIDFNFQLIRLNFSFVNKGRLRVEFERRELAANVEQNQIPFEITQGNSLGKNFFFRLNMDYKLSENIQTTVTYSAKKYGESEILHILRAEARAYF